ncbi:TIR domain-containing protein [Kitasatospora purpeofusca]|uniref:TIR domain-containing protein n=1 Tax=Kitasatospora purpeofusca TaxID=67352 RepID=UPI00068CB523|nr:nucleotide-binding protein [Kitasatospora purpeofusca]
MAKVRLVGSVDVMDSKLGDQISKGEEIGRLPRTTAEEVQEFQSQFLNWNEYTDAILQSGFEVDGALTLAPPGEFASLDIEIFDLKFGAAKTAEYVNAALTAILPKKLRVLSSIRDRLELWQQESPASEQVAMGDAIFLVHGRDHQARETVRGFLGRVTSRDVIVLDEEVGRGADILGKLLDHAQKASFAVVILTGDDEGGLAGASEVKPRARQNVILELGLFIGLLGRSRVIALYEPGVEIPSDFLGVTYVELDSNKGWRIPLAAELRAAGIEASIDRILG